MFTMFRRNTSMIRKVDRLESEIKRMTEQLDWVEDELRRISGAHQKLSGRYYARFGTGEASTPQANAAITSRDELRKLAGIVAGRPAPHK